MRKLRKSLDRFCYNHPRFGLPNLMLYIIIINAGLFFLNMMYRGAPDFNQFLYFNPYRIVFRGEVWRLVTFPFVSQDGNIITLAFRLIFYYFIGRTLEQVWGSTKFTLYFLSGYVMMVLFGFIYGFAAGGSDILLNAHYRFLNIDIVCYSMFFAVAVNCPDIRVLLFFIIPIKIKWLALILAGLYTFQYVYSFVLSPSFHYLIPVLVIAINFIIFCGADLLDYIRPNKYRYSSQTINFKKAAKKARKENEGRNYTHKCAVCGRTDVSNPELEFRYCSRCVGYHCFCIDHINNHVHFTQ